MWICFCEVQEFFLPENLWGAPVEGSEQWHCRSSFSQMGPVPGSRAPPASVKLLVPGRYRNPQGPVALLPGHTDPIRT